MARGWESKAIESQQDDARSAARLKPVLTPEERAREERRTSLELARAQTEAELAAARRAEHRRMLEMRLDAIRVELAAIAGDRV